MLKIKKKKRMILDNEKSKPHTGLLSPGRRRFLSLLLLSCAALIFLLFIPCKISARDINLDEIYIKRSSQYLRKIVLQKLDSYSKINAAFVDRDVVFAGWISGDHIIYIKEIPVSATDNINIIYRFNYTKHQSQEIQRLKGVITFARIDQQGKNLFIKRLYWEKTNLPEGETIIYNIRTGKSRTDRTLSPFMDFTISGSGGSIICEKGGGIVDYDPFSGNRRLVLSRSMYSDIIYSDNPSIAFMSPGKDRFLVINGGGGAYKAKLIVNNSGRSIKGISSCTELFWIDNYRFVYRKGAPGYFTAAIYNIRDGSSRTLVKNSLNTNITLSHYAGILSFLNNQVLMLYQVNNNDITNTGIEGEDISFNPAGRLFTTLMFKKLFVINLDTLKRRRIELRRTWKELLNLYNELYNKSGEFENSYSREYIRKKIEIYRKLTGL